jgi:hypothetical protein
MIAIFDIDGVLADDSSTRELDCREPAEHAEFARLITGISANPIRHVAQALACISVPVFVFTARSEALRMPTEEWLRENEIGIATTKTAIHPYPCPSPLVKGEGEGEKKDAPQHKHMYSNNNLYMRPMGNNDESHILKWKQLQGLLKSFEETSFNYGDILVFEDNAHCAKMFAQHGCCVYRPVVARNAGLRKIIYADIYEAAAVLRRERLRKEQKTEEAREEAARIAEKEMWDKLSREEKEAELRKFREETR